MLLIPELRTEVYLGLTPMVREWIPKIMIVDDDIEMLEELKELLSFNKYDVEVISNSSLAFKKACELNPDLVILDLRMKTKNGFQLADEIHHSFKTKTIPIIAITGFYTQQEHILMMKLCGIKSALTKPIDPQSLLEKIASVLAEAKNDPEQSCSIDEVRKAEQETGNMEVDDEFA